MWCHTDLHLILCFAQMSWLALVFKPSKPSLIFFFSLSRWLIMKLSGHEGFMSMSFFSFDFFFWNGNWGVLDSYIDKFFWVFRVGNFWGLAFQGAKQPAAVSKNWLGPVICPGLELCVLIYNRQKLFPVSKNLCCVQKEGHQVLLTLSSNYDINPSLSLSLSLHPPICCICCF